MPFPTSGVIRKSSAMRQIDMGIFEALAKIYTRKLATIEHPTCINKGGDYCRYIISWKTTSAYRWKIMSRYTLVLSLLLSIPLFFFLPLLHLGRMDDPAHPDKYGDLSQHEAY